MWELFDTTCSGRSNDATVHDTIKDYAGHNERPTSSTNRKKFIQDNNEGNRISHTEQKDFNQDEFDDTISFISFITDVDNLGVGEGDEHTYIEEDNDVVLTTEEDDERTPNTSSISRVSSITDSHHRETIGHIFESGNYVSTQSPNNFYLHDDKEITEPYPQTSKSENSESEIISENHVNKNHKPFRKLVSFVKQFANLNSFPKIEVKAGKKTQLHDLLEKTPDPDWPAIEKRMRSNPEEIIAYDENCMTPLACLCKLVGAPTTVFEAMLKVKPMVACMADKNNSFPLHFYASCPDAKREVIELLANRFQAATLQNKFGSTPLSIAIATDRGDYEENIDEVVMAFIQEDHGAASIPNKYGNYPLHYVGKQVSISTSTIELLIRLYPDALMKTNIYGATPIFLAVYWDAPFSTLQALLDKAPNAVSIRDEQSLDAVSSCWYLFVHKTKAEKVTEEFERMKENRQIMTEAESPFDLEGEVESWWDKMELLLRAAYHDTVWELPRSQLWRILHAAVGVNCPPNLVRFTLKLYRNQIFLKDNEQRLPVHIAAGAPVHTYQPFEPTGGKPVLSFLALINSFGVQEKDSCGRLPLHIALATKKTWDMGVSQLVQLYPQGLREIDPVTGISPFMLAAADSLSTEKLLPRAEDIVRNAFKLKEWRKLTNEQKDIMVNEAMAELKIEEFNTIYHIIRLAPDMVSKTLEIIRPGEKEKNYLREENAKLEKKIAEMKPDAEKLKLLLRDKKIEHNNEIQMLRKELAELKLRIEKENTNKSNNNGSKGLVAGKFKRSKKGKSMNSLF